MAWLTMAETKCGFGKHSIAITPQQTVGLLKVIKEFFKKHIKLTRAGICIWRAQFRHRRVLNSTLDATPLQTSLHSEHTVVQIFPLLPRIHLRPRLCSVFLRHCLLLQANQGSVGQVFGCEMLWAPKCLYLPHCSDPRSWYRHRGSPDASCMESTRKRRDERGCRWSIFARKLVCAHPPLVVFQ